MQVVVAGESIELQFVSDEITLCYTESIFGSQAEG